MVHRRDRIVVILRSPRERPSAATHRPGADTDARDVHVAGAKLANGKGRLHHAKSSIPETVTVALLAAGDLRAQVVHQSRQVALAAGSNLTENPASGEIRQKRGRAKRAEPDKRGVREGDSKWQRHSATDASTAPAHNPAKKSADQWLQAFVSTNDRAAAAWHYADLQPSLLVHRCPMEAATKCADVTRVANRTLDHVDKKLEAFRPGFGRDFNLVNDRTWRADPGVFARGVCGDELPSGSCAVRHVCWTARIQTEFALGALDVTLRNPDFARGLAHFAHTITAGERPSIARRCGTERCRKTAQRGLHSRLSLQLRRARPESPRLLLGYDFGRCVQPRNHLGPADRISNFGD